MKKILIIMTTLTILLLNITKVNAASANVSINVVNSSIVGKTITASVTISSTESIGAWKYNLNYDSSKLQLLSGQVSIADAAKNNSQRSVTYNYSFKVTSRGNANISLSNVEILAFNESRMSTSNPSRTISIMTQAEYEATLSKNNNLSSLSIEGFELNKAFNKDELEYSLEVENDVRNINVIANKEDDRSTISGNGNREINEGNNEIIIEVTAQNGSKKNYKINILVKELDPINVTLNDKLYTVVRKGEQLVKPEYFEETTVNINEFVVPSYYNKLTKITLVGLKDESGEINYFIYKNGKYENFNTIKSNSITILSEDIPSKLIPNNYIKSTLNINGNIINSYKINKNDHYNVVYGVNLQSGKKNVYIYDEKTESIVLFNKNITNLLEEEVLLRNIFLGTTAFFFILWIFTFSIKRRVIKVENDIVLEDTEKKLTKKELKLLHKKQKIERKKELRQTKLNKKMEQKENKKRKKELIKVLENVELVKEEPINEQKEESEKPLTKKELKLKNKLDKKLLKEEKKQAKKQKNDFLS